MIFVYIHNSRIPGTERRLVCCLSDAYMQMALEVEVYGALWGLRLPLNITDAYAGDHRLVASGRVIGILLVGIDRLKEMLAHDQDMSAVAILQAHMLLVTCETYLATVISNPDSYLKASNGLGR